MTPVTGTLQTSEGLFYRTTYNNKFVFNNNLDCPIGLEPINTYEKITQLHPNDTLTQTLPHIFSSSNIDAALKKKNTCPLCREPVNQNSQREFTRVELNKNAQGEVISAIYETNRGMTTITLKEPFVKIANHFLFKVLVGIPLNAMHWTASTIAKIVLHQGTLFFIGGIALLSLTFAAGMLGGVMIAIAFQGAAEGLILATISSLAIGCFALLTAVGIGGNIPPILENTVGRLHGSVLRLHKYIKPNFTPAQIWRNEHTKTIILSV